VCLCVTSASGRKPHGLIKCSDVSANLAVREGIGALATGVEWVVSDKIGRTEERGDMQWGCLRNLFGKLD
jgi:hypothetical protein